MSAADVKPKEDVGDGKWDRRILITGGAGFM